MERSVREILLDLWEMAQIRGGTGLSGPTSADDLREGRNWSGEFTDAVQEIERRISLRDVTIEAQGRVIDRLNDERPAYPGAWGERIAELERRNGNQRETIEAYAAEIERLKQHIERVNGFLMHIHLKAEDLRVLP